MSNLVAAEGNPEHAVRRERGVWVTETRTTVETPRVSELREPSCLAVSEMARAQTGRSLPYGEFGFSNRTEIPFVHLDDCMTVTVRCCLLGSVSLTDLLPLHWPPCPTSSLPVRHPLRPGAGPDRVSAFSVGRGESRGEG